MQGNIDFEEALSAARTLAFELERAEYRGLPHISAFAEKCADGNGLLLCEDEPMTQSADDSSFFDPAVSGKAVSHIQDGSMTASRLAEHDGTAATLARAICRGELSAEKTVEKYLSRTENDEYGAFITLMSDEARAAAARVDAAVRDGELFPLAGVPLSVKDNICTAGCRTSCASAALRDFVPDYSATVYERLLAAGCVPVGKANMDEFAVGSDGTTSYFGICKNPLDVSRTTGGSSSGSAASVASGEAVISLGSDTGGSARIPAVYCGLCALKPTYGAFSRYGLVGMAPSLEQISPIAACVDDLSLVFELAYGADGRDMTCLSYRESTLDEVSRTALLFIPQDAPSDVRNAVLHVAELMKAAGYSVRETTLPCFDDILGIYYTLSSAETASQLARYDGLRYGSGVASDGEHSVVKTRSATFGAPLRERLTEGTYVLTHRLGGIYTEALKLREHIRREMTHLLDCASVLITPATDREAIPIGESDATADRYAVYANLTGQPALVLPCARGESGLPLGVQLISRAGADRELLQIGRELERRLMNEKL